MAATSLIETADGLALSDGVMTVRGDFARLSPRIRPSNLNKELLVRAAKVKGVDFPTAIDATAGLGEDSFLLAAAGFQVTMFERNETIAELLEDAMERASEIDELADIVGCMQLVRADSVEGLRDLGFSPDVVFLDPMFPAKTKDAAAKKKLQLLQQLESPCDDELALFDAAQSAHPKKIVVKRPLKGPHLADKKPSYTLSGKAIRFDCYV